MRKRRNQSAGGDFIGDEFGLRHGDAGTFDRGLVHEQRAPS